MKKVYSKRAGKEVFALAPEQLEIFSKSGYKTPSPEEVIADAGAALIEPPEGKRSYVVFNFQTGAFAVRVRTCTLKGEEVAPLTGEIIAAGILKRFLENADPDRPKAQNQAPSVSTLGSTLGEILANSLKKAAAQNTPPAPDAPEVVSK